MRMVSVKFVQDNASNLNSFIMNIEIIAHQRVHYDALVSMYTRACQLAELGYKKYDGKRITKKYLQNKQKELYEQFPHGKPEFQ